MLDLAAVNRNLKKSVEQKDSPKRVFFVALCVHFNYFYSMPKKLTPKNKVSRITIKLPSRCYSALKRAADAENRTATKHAAHLIVGIFSK